LASFADVCGSTALHDWLQRVDEPAAQAIDYRNVRRVIRALEVYLVTGTPISVHQQKHPPPYQILQIGLTRPRDILYRRIDERVDQMMEAGLLEEVRGLLAAGYGWNLSSMASLGYRQFTEFFNGKATLEETVESIKTETHRFVRHQDAWFRRDDPSIIWFDLEESTPDQIEACVGDWLEHLA
jgi:tRNA dimethylallyltransferase